jgi:di/tricarboxylate transporter
MFVAAFASMWISNVAAPVLCLSIIQVRTVLVLFTSPTDNYSPCCVICRPILRCLKQ